jgi:pimeloyl-ACP methyl ester carboxylesterase
MITTIAVSGASITLEVDGDGPPVLLLHGFPASRQLWSRVAPALIGFGFRVIVPDLVGYGSADAPPGVRIDMGSQAHWIGEMLDALRVARVVIVAHDVGSAVAQILMANVPQRVRGLAVLDGVYAGNWAMDAVASIRDWDPAEAHRLYPILVRRLAKSGALRETLAAYEGEAGGLRLIRAARDLDPRQTEDIAEALQASGVPSLVLWGESDRIFPIDSVARPLAELLSAKLTVLPGGHFTPVDCPDEVVACLREFLSFLPA